MFNRIPFYEDLHLSPEMISSCGYFKDVFSETQHFLLRQSSRCVDIDILLRLSTNMQEHDNVLLVFFGCFAPLHKGHMSAINITKERCIKQNKHVIGCLLFQSHDDYIMMKKGITCDNIRQHAYLDKVNLAAQNIFVDDFSNQQEGELNFPYLLLRSLSYFPKTKRPEICVILGEDNKGFSRVYHPNITYSIVSRSNVEENPYYNVSSTKIRNNLY